MGKLQRAVTLILRCESKFSHVKSRVLTHSACWYKNYLPKCSQFPQTFFAQEIFFFFQGDQNTKQKKKLSENHHIVELDA